MAKFVLETEAVEDAANSINTISKNSKDVVKSVEGYDIDSTEFDFAGAKDAVETNVKGAYGKFKLTNNLLKSVVQTHTTLQESVSTSNTNANSTDSSTYSGSNSYSGGYTSGGENHSYGGSNTRASVPPAMGYEAPAAFDMAALISAGKIAEITEDAINKGLSDDYRIVIRVDKNDPNYKSYIETVYNYAKKYGIQVCVIYISDSEKDKTTKVTLMKGSQELNAFDGVPTKEKMEKLFAGVPDANKAELESMKKNDFVNYYQGDYGSTPYGPLTIASGGCGPTSAAMVLTYLTGETVDPVATCDFSAKNGFVDSSGTYESMFPAIAKAYNVSCTKAAQTASNIISNLQQGKVIIAHMGPGTFTKGGHYIVLRGLDANGNVIVADPASRERSNTTYPASIFEAEANGSMYCFS